MKKHAKCIYFVKDGEAQKFVDDRLNFEWTKTVVVNKDLYAFTEAGGREIVSAHKIAHYTSTESLVKTDLPDLHHGL